MPDFETTYDGLPISAEMEWVSFDEACRRCRPAVVVDGLRLARDAAAAPWPVHRA